MTILNKILLFCGILATVVYIGTDTYAAMNSAGYSYLNQSVSELSAVGVSTRPLWIVMTFVFNPLLIAFGAGLIRIARKISLRITGILFILWGATGFFWLLVPMNVRGEIGSTNDTLHLVMAAFTVFLILMFLISGSFSLGRYFKHYTIFTLLVVLFFGIMVARQVPLVTAGLPTPWMGVMERISSFLPMIWMSVLGYLLLKNRG